VRRREFIALVGGAVAWPSVVRAQQPSKVPRIGFLFYGTPELALEVDAFRQGLRELRYIEGQNITVEYRFGKGRVGTLPELAAADVVGAGLVTNFGRPGGNITGLASTSAELGGKRLEFLKGIVPEASRVAVLYNPDDLSNVLVLKDLQAAAPALSLELQPVEVRAAGDFKDAFVTMGRQRVHAFFGAAGVLTFANRQMIVDLAAKERIPAIWGHRQFVDVGGLMSYAVNFYDQCRRAATYVDQILKGAKPGDLPVQQPTKFEFIINLKTAKALGITVPPSLLAQVDEVIE
jgi:putative tryptophan/tyrosine transport system substrate-binding protein